MRREWEGTYGWTSFCYEDYQLSLQVRRDLQSDFVLLRSLAIKLASKKRLAVGLILFFFIWWPNGLASERDRQTLLVSKTSTCDKETSLKKKKKNFFLLQIHQILYLGSSVSPTENDINMQLAKAWTAIDRLSVI